MTSRLKECLKNRKPGRPLIVAHRGASAEAPENTLASIKKGWSYDVNSVEVDIHLSADRRCVVIHDPTTQRTAGQDKAVAACTVAELKKLDAGSWFNPHFAGERIPVIEEVLETIPASRFLCVELKEGNGLEETLRDCLNAAGCEESVCILSFDPQRVARFKKLFPSVPGFLIFEPEIDPKTKTILPCTAKIIEQVRACGGDAPACFEGAVTKEFVEMVHKAGMPLLAWVINDPARAKQLAAWGVDALATDDPAKILPVFKS